VFGGRLRTHWRHRRGGRLVATIPIIVAAQILRIRPRLRLSAIPFPHEPGSIDLLWPTALDGDPACRFVRHAIVQIVDARDPSNDGRIEPHPSCGQKPVGAPLAAARMSIRERRRR
jgi:hypothetical protein